MPVAIILAAARNGAIGNDNKLLWHLPNDFKFFKTTTMSCPVIMGRKTFDSIGRPLPGRMNIIVSKQLGLLIEGCTVFNDLSDALVYAKGLNDKVFVIGGASIYSQVLPIVDEVYLTKVDVDLAGDAFFGALNPQEWKEVWSESHLADDKHQFNYSFHRYLRV